MQENLNRTLTEFFRKKFRKKVVSKNLIAFYFLIYTFISVTAQSDSLYKYLELAASNNPGVQMRFTEYKAALQKVPQAGSLADPQLSLGFFLKPMELVGGNQVADITLMQMFPWFGVLRNAKDEMSLMANAKFEVFRDAKLQLFYDVQRTWYEIYKVRKEIEVSENNIDILKTIERIATVRFQASPSGNSPRSVNVSGVSSASSSSGFSGGTSGMQGMSGGSIASIPASPQMQTGSMGSSSGNSGLADLFRIQLETGELQNNIYLLKSSEETIIARFNSYLNRPSDSNVYTDEVLSNETLGMSLTAVSDSIRAGNPMLNMLDFEKQAYSARKKMVTGMGYPMVGIGLNYSLIGKSEMSSSPMNGKDMVMPMVSVTLPVYRKKYLAMQKEAELLSLAASQNYQATSNSLQTEYYQALQLYHDSQRRVTLYENQSELASKSLELMLKSFSASSSSLTDILRLRQQTLDYELKQVEASADFNTSVAWLQRLMASFQVK